MSERLLLAAIVGGTGIVACAATRVLIPLLRKTLLDRPNERSSHTVPTPRGGGIAVIGAIVLGWLCLYVIGAAGRYVFGVALPVILLAAVSWVDDRRGLSPATRLAAQIIAIALGMYLSRPEVAQFRLWLPQPYGVWLDVVLVPLELLWFVNLFNFMDGIDGIAGSEAAAIGVGLVLFASFGVGYDPALATLAATVAAAAVGFLVWNWAPARVFLGDVGSVPLGYLLGYLLLSAAARGHWRIALILPLYFLADATITLLRRLIRGERVWQAHREHFYQRAVQRGLGHAAVVRRVIAADLVLIGCGWAAENGWGSAALTVAGAVVLALLASLAGSIPRTTPRREEPPP